MALQPLISGGLWLPSYPQQTPGFAANTYTIDASGEKAVLVFRAPKTGNLDRFDFDVATVTNSPDNGLRASFQSVDASGLASGTILGATNNALVTYADPVTTGWKSTNFGEVAAVTAGDILAAVVEIPSFTAGDSIVLTHMTLTTGGNIPYGISAASTKQSSQRPVFAIHYTDGYACISPAVFASLVFAGESYDVDTAVADEWGMAFSLPFPARLAGVGIFGSSAAGADFEVIVYDSASTALRTISCDGDHSSITGNGVFEIPLTSPLDLAANTTYRVTVRPTTLANVSVPYNEFSSLALMDTLEGGRAFYSTSRLNQSGSWTDYNSGTFRRPRISLYLSALDDGAGAGAGIARLVGRGLAA